jgi:hypothetical protein
LVTFASQNVAPISAASFSPLSLFMSSSATLTPCLRSARAVASPKPDAPPVMTAAIEEFSSMAQHLSFF